MAGDDGWRLLDEPGRAAPFDQSLPQLEVRRLGPGVAAARVATSAGQTNGMGGLHGGYLAAVAEQSQCLPLYLDGRIDRDGCVTVDFSVKYVAGGVAGIPLDAEVTCLRETGRLGFISGLIRQNGELVLAFTGTLRKLPRR
jgi:acyl-coenzyme A thioesterase PaaI-like protein